MVHWLKTTTGSPERKALICGACRFLWYKYSGHGWFQTPNKRSLNRVGAPAHHQAQVIGLAVSKWEGSLQGDTYESTRWKANRKGSSGGLGAEPPKGQQCYWGAWQKQSPHTASRAVGMGKGQEEELKEPHLVRIREQAGCFRAQVRQSECSQTW